MLRHNNSILKQTENTSEQVLTLLANTKMFVIKSIILYRHCYLLEKKFKIVIA